ncbi:MAG: lipoate--protein ligase [Desulfosarcina sp.]|nr:lipoate--protein ligase [Desulfobacterales bacterium]
MQRIDFGPPRNPALNLAWEEHLLTRLAETGDLLLFYVNDEAVVIGRNQNPWAEVSAESLTQMGLPLVRRMSGGGAVYQDHGNLNYSILQLSTTPGRPDAKTILQPVVRALRTLGLPARLSARNAIFVGRYKVSGTAQFMTSGKILTHGTLLVDARLDRLSRCLRPDTDTLAHSRGRPSVRSPVANLCTYRPEITRATLRRQLHRAFAETYGTVPVCALDPAGKQAARLLADRKYRTWQWNIGRSPQFTIEWKGDFRGEACGCRMTVQRGVIAGVAMDAPATRQDQLQRLAERWLVGHRLGDQNAPGDSIPATPTTDAASMAFRRWLQAHLPKPLPIPAGA